jgi:uncharacterized Zn finger protein
VSWWGRRWIAAAESLGAAYANRLPRGRRYAADGSVLDLQVAPGQVAAKVQGRRPNPYRVRLRLPELTDEEWERVAEVLAAEVRHAAALVDGRLPEDVDDLLRDVDVSLFPHPGELETSCSCPDVANPCKHAAAVHYVLADSIDADPFLLTALRGRDRDDLLAVIQAARAAEEPAGAEPGDDVEDLGDGRLSALSAATLFEAADGLTAIEAHVAPGADPGATLRRLGTPPGFGEPDVATLTDVVRRTAGVAWSLAAEPDRDDPLLTALRERGSATAGELGEALGTPAAEVRAGLNALIEEGLVHRTGHARSTRYYA